MRANSPPAVDSVALDSPAREMRPKVENIKALTSIRGLAAWWVVIYHFRDALPNWMPKALSGFWEQGDLAVDIFFVLSGFVIALNYAPSFEGKVTAKAVRRFFLHRFARVYPLHIFIMLAFLANPVAIMLFSHTRELGDRYNPLYFFLSVALVQNWGFTRELAWNIPAWSVSTEWLAYLLFPLFILMAGRALRTWTRALLACVGIASILVVAYIYLQIPKLSGDITQFGLIRCVAEFCMGVCVFYFRSSISPAVAKRTSAVAGVLAASLTAVVIIGLVDDFVVLPLAFAAFIFALSIQSSLLSRVFSSKPLYCLGMISYSTYMIHYFVKDWVKFLLVTSEKPSPTAFLIYILLVVGASIGLYYAIEVPGRDLIRDWTKKQAICGTLPTQG